MSSGGPLPTQLGSPPFAPPPFPYLFPSPQQGAAAVALFQQQVHQAQQVQQQQRLKLKRQRQRVDAGEPRNSYQQPKVRDSNMPIETTTGFPWLDALSKLDHENVTEEQPTDLSMKSEKDELEILNEDDPEVDVAVEVDEHEEEEKVRLSVEPTSSETPVSHESANSHTSSSSSSKRKSFQPQKNFVQDTNQENNNESMAEDDAERSFANSGAETREPEAPAAAAPAPTITEKFSALQSQLNANKFSDIFEVQKKLYANIMEQKSIFPQAPPVESNKRNNSSRDLAQLAQNLKKEIMDSLGVSIDKVMKEWAIAELARIQMENATRPPPMPAMFNHPVFAPPNPLQFALPQMANAASNGIFPNGFNGFNPLANALNSFRRPFESEEPKKKRSKVTDAPKKECTPSGIETSPCSERNSPLLNDMSLSRTPLSSYFPPTLVGHPLYGGASFNPDRDESPANSDDFSDCGPLEAGQSTTLTPMHLRKAKLMFFYTRYPNSALLKSYFPDIRFNKNNTAQLVKWFSNFREFYYIQMEKYARQALGEGIRDRGEIFITSESELFKTLNQHYNRNNHIQPPEKLVYVVQETLREFFDAIKLGKDQEPSWKKTIYKIINRLDDAIPERFKDTDFLQQLDS